MRQVVLAAAVTVLGVFPLLKDVFWVGLAVSVKGGLTSDTIVAMVPLPVLYATIHRLKPARI